MRCFLFCAISTDCSALHFLSVVGTWKTNMPKWNTSKRFVAVVVVKGGKKKCFKQKRLITTAMRRFPPPYHEPRTTIRFISLLFSFRSYCTFVARHQFLDYLFMTPARFKCKYLETPLFAMSGVMQSMRGAWRWERWWRKQQRIYQVMSQRRRACRRREI